jgi:hypothetical protein
MWTATIYTLLAAMPLAMAQTYPGFLVDIPTKLDVLYGDINVENGQQLPRAGQYCSRSQMHCTDDD